MKKCSVVFLALVVLTLAYAPASVAQTRNFVAHLSGDQEVPAAASNATGQTVFKASKDGSELEFMLMNANIDNVVQAHIHLGVPGINGPVVAFLFGPVGGGGGPADGVLARGTITAGNLIGPLAGQDLSVLLAALETGGAYVNVHTFDSTLPLNSPGNFPGGEVRGQIRPAGR